MLLALLGIILLIVDPEISGIGIVNDGINAIIARIVFVGISVTGATFCAKQFINQKHIADDYGYKLVLAKSINAFAKEIKKHKPEKAAEYMKELLDEINKSPVEQVKDNDGLTKKNIGIVQKLYDMFSKTNQ